MDKRSVGVVIAALAAVILGVGASAGAAGDSPAAHDAKPAVGSHDGDVVAAVVEEMSRTVAGRAEFLGTPTVDESGRRISWPVAHQHGGASRSASEIASDVAALRAAANAAGAQRAGVVVETPVIPFSSSALQAAADQVAHRLQVGEPSARVSGYTFDEGRGVVTAVVETASEGVHVAARAVSSQTGVDVRVQQESAAMVVPQTR